jgi:prolyl 4-hydroxylase
MTNIDIDFYCRAYDDFLSPEECEEYIDKYEETLRVDNEKWKNLSVCIRNDGSKDTSCGMCNCDRMGPMEYERFSELNDMLIHKWQGSVKRYTKDCGIENKQWPKDIGWEELRIKRFKVNEKENHGLSDHVDVYTHAHAKRFLCLMVYLNDDFEDGETYFPIFDIKVKPKKGRLLIFPPTWNYLHRGIPPRSPSKLGAKYFIMTHLNYTDLSLINEGTSFTDRNIPAYDLNTKKMTKEELAWPKS